MIADVAPETTLAPFVGRAEEVQRLTELVGLEGEPGGHLVLGGDAGVGKSRLIDELGARARAAGWRVLVGHCLDFGDSAMPYLPFSDAFGRLAADEVELAQSLVEAGPSIARLLPAQRVLAVATDEMEPTEPAALFDAVFGALSELGRHAPLLFVVEDVHWADQSTRELLTFLFTRRFAAPVVVLASYRSDDLHRGHRLRPTLNEWGRLPSVSAPPARAAR